MHLVYAIGGRFLETTGETGDFQCERHCERATASLGEIIQQHSGLRSIQILVLLSLYNLRSPRGPGAWTFCGLAMRQCIELGLHRQTCLRWPLIEEMRRRVFWTCYCLDRQVSIILGRPFAISDRDIDVSLPTDVAEDIEDERLLEELQEKTSRDTHQIPPRVSTSMTGFIYLSRLRMIESEIQQTIYRVDRAPADTKAAIEGFITRLDEWKAQMPLDAGQLPDFSTMRVDGYQNYVSEAQTISPFPSYIYIEADEELHGYFLQMVYYYKCVRFLLYPIILSPEVAGVRFLRLCAEACAGVCRIYKRLHQAVPVGFSVMALHSVFVAGLTLLYCVWAAPREAVGSSDALNACSIVLYVIAERWVGARKYRDVFDAAREAVMASVEVGGGEPRRAVPGLKEAVVGALRAAGSDERECGREFSAMVSDMAGDATYAKNHNDGSASAAAVTTGMKIARCDSGGDGMSGRRGEKDMDTVGGATQGLHAEYSSSQDFSESMFPLQDMALDNIMLGFPSFDDMDMAVSGQVSWSSTNYAGSTR